MRNFILIISFILLSCGIQSPGQENKNMNEPIETISINKLAKNHWQTYSDTIIEAPVNKVWNTLTNWNNIANWSSSLKEIYGNLKDGSEVFVSYLVEGITHGTKHKFIYKENVEFGWSDPMKNSFEGLFDNHRFRVEKISPNQTRFIQSDDFRGEGNDNMSAEDVANAVVDFFPVFNRELKLEVEKSITNQK